MTGPTPELRLTLTGTDAELGKISASDIGRLLIDMERAVARSAAVVMGQPTAQPGPRPAPVAAAAKLKLRAIEPGSVTTVLELPTIPHEIDALDMDVAHLADVAVERLLDVIDERREAGPAIMAALIDLGRDLGIGQRFDRLDLRYRGRGASGSRLATVDGAKRRRLEEYQRRLAYSAESGSVTGMLFEADFERMTAQIRDLDGRLIPLTFRAEQAEAVKDALRDQASAVGEIVYEPGSGAVRSVEAARVFRAEVIPGIDSGEFRKVKTFVELQIEQGLTTTASLADSYDPSVSDDDRDAFGDALVELGVV